MFVEAMLFAIDRINRDSSILHGLKLRTRIYDTCGDKRYLRNVLASAAIYRSQGVIGPQYSDDAIVTTTVMNIFGKNTISFAATTPDLENRIKYNYFYRTVPSDYHSVQMLLSIAMKFKWKYIAMISSQGSYGQRATELFRNAAKELGVCIPVDKTLPETAEEKDYKFLIQKIKVHKPVKVVYLILKEHQLMKFFKMAENMRSETKDLNFVVGDGWGTRSFIAPSNVAANGTLTFQVDSTEVKEFREYFLSLKPKNNTRNIWFKEFWEQTFDCSFKKRSDKKTCTGDEELIDGVGYFKDTPVLNVINAVYSYAYAFKKVIWHECLSLNKTAKNCSDSGMLIGLKSYKNILSYIERTKFKEPFRDRIFEYNSHGSHDENYSIYNFVASKNEAQDVIKKVGSWDVLSNQSNTFTDNDLTLTHLKPEAWRLSLDVENIIWKGDSIPVSICSKPCDLGFIRRVTSKCCWQCVKCQGGDIIKNNTCVSCHLDSLPDPTRSYCVPLPVKDIWVHSKITTPIICLCTLGILSTLGVVALFLKHFNTRLVRASSRELCMLMLFGICLTFVSPVSFIPPPGPIICYIQRLIVGISLTSSYAPLLLRTNRIYRIFRSAATTVSRPSLISPRSQVVMSLALTGIACLIGLVSILGRSPKITIAHPGHREFVIKYCELSEQTMLVNLSFSAALMIATTWFAVKTRNFPKNYNEAKYIGFTMYTTCLVLAIIITVFFFVAEDDVKSRTLLLSSVCWINATLNLIGLFGNKVKLLLTRNAIESDSNATTIADTTINVQMTGVRRYKTQLSGHINVTEK